MMIFKVESKYVKIPDLYHLENYSKQPISLVYSSRKIEIWDRLSNVSRQQKGALAQNKDSS